MAANSRRGDRLTSTWTAVLVGPPMGRRRRTARQQIGRVVLDTPREAPA